MRWFESLSERAGLPMPRFYICRRRAPNAFDGSEPASRGGRCHAGGCNSRQPRRTAGVIRPELAREIRTRSQAPSRPRFPAFSRSWPSGVHAGWRQQPGRELNPLVAFGTHHRSSVIKAMISRSRNSSPITTAPLIAGAERTDLGAFRNWSTTESTFRWTIRIRLRTTCSSSDRSAAIRS